MRFVSTRGQASPATLTEALRNGAAPDGGLYMPQELPAANLGELDPEAPLSEFAAALLRPFFAGDALEPELPAICAEALDFTAPLVTPNAAKPRLQALELFHGPTGAFKDFGARFLMACFGRIADASPLTVLAATSGASSCSRRVAYPLSRSGSSPAGAIGCWQSKSMGISTTASGW